LPSDFISVIPAGLLPYPGVCRFCGSNKRDCVDFGINTEYDGATLICVDCFKGEIVKVESLGLMTTDQAEQLRIDNAELILKITATEMLKKEMRDGVVAVLDSYESDIADTARDLVSVPASDEGPTGKLF